MKKHIVVDVEASGPVPGLYDLISVGMVVMTSELNQTFYMEFAPLHDDYLSGAYDSIGVTREQHLAMPDPEKSTLEMVAWLDGLTNDRLTLWSDNPAFDYQFVSWMSHKFVKRNPFGHSARRIGDLSAGLKRKPLETQGWKKHRKTSHTHNALDDALGNAEALNAIFEQHGVPRPW
jgi:hypothetical protein